MAYDVTLDFVPTYIFQPHILLFSALQCVLDFLISTFLHTHHAVSHFHNCAHTLYLFKTLNLLFCAWPTPAHCSRLIPFRKLYKLELHLVLSYQKQQWFCCCSGVGTWRRWGYLQVHGEEYQTLPQYFLGTTITNWDQQISAWSFLDSETIILLLSVICLQLYRIK